MSLYDKYRTKIWTYVNHFNEVLALTAKDDFIKEHVVKNGKEILTFLIHEKKFNDFKEKYTNQERN